MIGTASALLLFATHVWAGDGKLKAACQKMPSHCTGSKALDNAHAKECSRVIHLAGIFPLTGSKCFEGIQSSAAASQAILDINTEGGPVDHKLLGPMGNHDGHCVILHTRDSKDEPGMALHQVDKFMKFGAWDQYSHIDAVIGGLSSPVSEAVQQLVQWSGIPQISYGSTAPQLSNKEEFPTFLRTVASDNELIDGIVQFLLSMEWEQITVLASDTELSVGGAALLRKKLSELHESRMEVAAIKTFNDRTIDGVLDSLKEGSGRVIFLHCTTLEADDVFASAAKKGMLHHGWGWIGTDWAQDALFDEFKEEGAELKALKLAMSGLVALRPKLESTHVTKHVARHLGSAELNLTADLESCAHVRDAKHVASVAHFAYDAVLVAVTAVHRAVQEYGEAAASNFTAVFEELKSLERNTVSSGATGSIKVNANGDRIMDYSLVNLNSRGEWIEVGEYKHAGRLELFGDTNTAKIITWPGGSSEIPADREVRHTSTAALYLFLFMTFIVISICAGNFLHAHHFYYLPESGAVIILGLALGAILNVMAGASNSTAALIEMTEFDTEFFTLILLPVIIFSAGFNLKKADFFRNIVPILLCAFVGTSISTGIVAYAVFELGEQDFFEFGKFNGAESLAFGALISAVDPVATLAVFGALGVETNLNMRVFGESVINDGVSIVLFRVFTGFFTEDVNADSIMAGVGMFFYIVIGSVLFGCFTAIVVAVVLKFAAMHSHVLESGIVILGSYCAFSGAEALGMSGIIGSMFCGIGMNHWTYHNFTYDGEVLSRRSVKMFSLLADTVIFFQVGQNIVVNVVNPDWGLIGITLIFCLIGRACNIFPLCALYNLCVKEQSRVSLKDQVVMLHAGLRGAIAFALALTFPSHNIHIVLNTTMWVILFTIFVLGGSCTSVLTVLRVDMGVKSNDVGDTKKSRHSKELTNVFQKFDRLVILPLVTWRFTYDGADTYIEDPSEARAMRKGRPGFIAGGGH